MVIVVRKTYLRRELEVRETTDITGAWRATLDPRPILDRGFEGDVYHRMNQTCRAY